MMHRPVLVTAPTATPVSLAEAKLHLRVDGTADDTLINALLAAAVTHLDGWAGTLGICLEQQTWRQDFDGWARHLMLPLGPVISVSGVTVTSAAGADDTIAGANYELQTDAGGRSFVRFVDDYQPPSDQAETRAFKVTFTAGHAQAAGPTSTVPEPIRQAMLLLIGHWYRNREAVDIGNTSSKLPLAVDALLDPYRRFGR